MSGRAIAVIGTATMVAGLAVGPVEAVAPVLLGVSTSAESAAEDEDIQRLAAGLGMDVEQARARFEGQNTFNRSLVKVEEALRSRFAGADRHANETWFTGQPLLGDRELIAQSFGSSPPAAVYGMKYSETELEDLTKNVHRRVSDILPPDSPMESVPDKKTGHVTITVADSAVAVEVSQTLIALKGAQKVAVADVDVRVDPELRLGQDRAVQGGSVLSTCTGAFLVYGGIYVGLITAEHCNNFQSYGGQNILTFYAQSVTTEGDMQWHTSSTGAIPRFRATSTSYRDVNENLPVRPGDGVCRFGKVTNTACGTLASNGACYNTENGYYCNISLANQSMGSLDGDSGGPVYWGNAALGVWKGSNNGHGAFTPTSSMHTNVLRGVHILEAR